MDDPRQTISTRPPARRRRDQPVEVETLSARPLEGLRGIDAATWIHRLLKRPDLRRQSRNNTPQICQRKVVNPV